MAAAPMLELVPHLVSLWLATGAPSPQALLPSEPPLQGRVVFPEHPSELRAFAHAAMQPEQCYAELKRRGVPHLSAPRHDNVSAPVRLPRELHGVRFEHWQPTQRQQPERPLLDCRLLLALSDLARIGRQHDVSVVRYNSLVRGSHASKPGWRHPTGVAVDINELQTSDGERWNILHDFQGAGIGKTTCRSDSPWPRGAKSRRLRAFVCDLHAAHVFNLILTPHYDYRHRDHLHLEVRQGIDWYLTR